MATCCFFPQDGLAEMDIRYKNSQEPVMDTPELELAKFQIETSKQIVAWTNTLIAQPEQLDELERDIDQYYRNAAGRIVATILHTASKHAAIDERVDDIIENASATLRKSVGQHVVLRLLCGLVLEVSTLYCAPERLKNNRDNNIVTEKRRGLYPELALYGFAKKIVRRP